MNTTILSKRERMHKYIDALPEYRLDILEPLLADMSEPDFLIETDLTDEELAVIAEGDKRLEEHPEEFITLQELRKLRLEDLR
jgi:hypothetical protein